MRFVTGVKSQQGSRIGRCGWITSFLETSFASASTTYRLFHVKQDSAQFWILNDDSGSVAQLVRAPS